jgi:hypothetical protein
MSLPYIDAKNGRPSDMIAYLQNIVEQQERVIDILKGALATHGIEAFPVVEHWGDVRLTPQESALVGALYAVFPKAINRYQLLELLPGQDRVKERTITTVGVVVHKRPGEARQGRHRITTWPRRRRIPTRPAHLRPRQAVPGRSRPSPPPPPRITH